MLESRNTIEDVQQPDYVVGTLSHFFLCCIPTTAVWLDVQQGQIVAMLESRNVIEDVRQPNYVVGTLSHFSFAAYQ